ncbi:MAG: type ISP restriction/modification enzyme [Mycobacteriales bacterium]
MSASPAVDEAAATYLERLALLAGTTVDAEPEAQLTTPVALLLESLGADAGLALRLVREVRLPGVRPDFAVLLNERPTGWVELKAPSKNVDGRSWRGRDGRQWERLRELDGLLVCNGRQAQLFSSGEPIGQPLSLPGEPGWDPPALQAVLRTLVEARPVPVRRVSELATRLAPLARMLRERLLDALRTAPPVPAAVRARTVWSAHVHTTPDDSSFSNEIAQVITYALAIAALRGGADRNADGLLTLDEAREALRAPARVLAAALGPVLDVAGLLDVIGPELAAVERLVSVVDVDRLRRSRDPRGEPWLYFYEDFLAAYDPQARQAAGVYYTPTAVVQCQVRLVDHVLREVFGRPLGFGAKEVVTLDPASGSGTYPLAVIDQAEAVALAERGAGGPKQIAPTLAQNLLAFELLPGPYAVSHLRIGERFAELAGVLAADMDRRLAPQVLLTDTLDSPYGEAARDDLFGDSLVLAEERAAARVVKADRRITVVLGNPPYDRVAREDAGGWVTEGDQRARGIFEDVLDDARQHTIFSHHASLYNLYVYFWRWALWKAFEQQGRGPAVVSFITASSWLTGPGFVGLRRLARELADEIWVIDLGGDNKGARPEENVFAIETPVAIVTLVRKAASDRGTPAAVHYRRLRGTRADKFAALDRVEPPAQDPPAWREVVAGWREPLVPPAGGASWLRMPLLTDVFPWQQPGCKMGRTWPIATDPDVLRRRWQALVSESDLDARAAAHVTPRNGRTIFTSVAGLPRLADLRPDAAPPPVVRYGFRSFDREWILADPRLAKTESPSLWTTSGRRQVYLTTLTSTALGPGPAATVTAAVPDLHHFSGRGGKDVIPLYRDAAGQTPNVHPAVLEQLTQHHRAADPQAEPVSAERLFAYAYAVLAGADYVERFAEALETPGPRLPLTLDPALFAELAEHGEHLLWLHTFAERFRGTARGPRLPRGRARWQAAVTAPPRTLEEVRYDPHTHELRIGNGVVSGVPPEVWTFSVSGLQVLRKWLGYRTVRGTGRAASSASPLDALRPDGWQDEWNDELLDLVECLAQTSALLSTGALLLDRVMAGEVLDGAQLPPVAQELRRPGAAAGPEPAPFDDAEDLDAMEETLEILADVETMRALAESHDDLAHGRVSTAEELAAAMARRAGRARGA